MADEIKKTVVVQTEVEGSKSIDELAKDVKIAGISFNDLSKGIAGAGRSLKATTTATKLFSKALLASGIGAIVLALGALLTFLTKSQKGMDLMTKATEALSAIFAVVIDRVVKFGEGLFKLFTGDFKGGLESIRGAFSGIVDEISAAVTQSQIFAQSIIDLEIAQIKFITTQARLTRDLNEQRRISNDSSQTANDRLEANLAAQRIQNDLSVERIRLAQLAFDSERENQKGLTDTQKAERDNQRQFNEAQAAVIDAVAKANNDQIKLLTREKSLRTEVLNVQKQQTLEVQAAAAAAAEAAATEEANRQVFVTARKKDIEDLSTLDGDAAQKNLATGAELIAGIKIRRDAEAQAAQDREDELASLAQLERDNAANALDLIGSVASQTAALGLENAALTKSIAFFESVINTISAIVKALPNIPLAVAVGALGAAQTAKILSTPLPSKAEGGAIDIGGQRHSSGGTKFYGTDGTAFEAERGEKLFVLSRGASAAFNNLSSFNSIFSGNQGGSFLQDGGLVSPAIAGADAELNISQFALDVIRELPPPEVSVLKIERASREVNITRNRGEL